MYFDRNATQNPAKRGGSGGMHRPSNAAWVLPQAVNSLWWNPGQRRDGRGARLTRRVTEEYRVYFDRNATQSPAKRGGSAGISAETGDRPSNAAWVLPQAVNSLWWNPGERRDGRGARLTRRVREEYRVYFDRNATQSPAKRGGSGGMHRPSNAAWVLPQAVKDSSRTRRDEPAPELPTALFSRRQKPRAHDWDRVSLSSLAPSCCPCNHPLCLRVRVNRNQLDLWMLHGKYAEYLICKSSADGLNFCEVE